jgi:hypothetical protein
MFFDKKLELDPEIGFHGTSSCFESCIDSEGFAPNRSSEWRDAIERLVALFRALDWCGTTGASRAVLEPFSLNHDHADPRGKPIYFAETSDRAVGYASSDFAGGENARALRYSFDDLRAFLNDPELRAEHLKRLTHGARTRGVPPPLAIEQAKKQLAAVDFAHLRNELEALHEVEREVRAYVDAHRYGVIYAVRLTDIEALEYHNFMGVKSFSPIPPGRIVAKRIVLPSEACRDGDDSETIEKFIAWGERFPASPKRRCV